MAADDTSTWGNLPGIIIVEILSYLTLKDRLNAATVCRRWRSCLWHPSLWKSFTFTLKIGSRHRSKHLADRCGRFVQCAVVELDSTDSWDVTQAEKVLSVISQNRNLQVFTLRPTSCHIEWPDREGIRVIEQFHANIIRIIETARRLKHFALGNAEELFYQTEHILDQLAQHHRDSIESLHISSVKEDPENYEFLNINVDSFTPFRYLRILSLDYDYLSNSLLISLATDRVEYLQKLIVNVHGTNDHEKLTDSNWKKLKDTCSGVEVTLNLIHSEDGVTNLTDILRSNMPLVHFRSFFCSHINTAAIDFISQHNHSSLQSVHIVDGIINRNQPNVYTVVTDEDPFVMLAWKCSNLNKFIIIGYSILDENLVAIARLRGPHLKDLHVAQCCVASVESDINTWPDGLSHGQVARDFYQEISGSLGRDWRPVADADLHPAVLDLHADAETVYHHILLRDQHWEP